MLTTEITATLSKAKKSHKYRETSLTWRSGTTTCAKLDHTSESVGILVRLTFEHDQRSKRFTATLRQAHWSNGSQPNITVEYYSPFEPHLNPRVEIASVPVARYSESAFQRFVTDTLTVALPTCAHSDGGSELVRNLLITAGTLSER